MKTPRKRRRRAARPAAPASHAGGTRTKALQRRERERLGDFIPKAAHWRYLRAYCELLEEGAPVTFQALARRLGRHRQSIWNMRRSYPGLDAWMSDQLHAVNQQMTEPILAKMASLALRGSVAHAEVYFKVIGLVSGAGATANVNVQNAGPQVIHIAVPRQGDAPVACSGELLPVAERGSSSSHDQTNRRAP